MEYQFDYCYFFEVNGNLCLQTNEQRITEAVALLKKGDTIVFPDGKKASNEKELKNVLEKHSKKNCYQRTCNKDDVKRKICFTLPPKICLIICILITLLFPFILNYLLLKPAMFAVIGGNNGPIVWLQFWGCYITAIATLVMAVSAWKAIHAENERHRYNVEKQDFLLLEERISKYELLHNFEQITIIRNLYSSIGYSEAIKAIYDNKIKIQTVGLELVQFNNHSNPLYVQYGKTLCMLNIKMFDLLSGLENLIEYCENGTDEDRQIKIGNNIITLQNNVIDKGKRKEYVSKFYELAYEYYTSQDTKTGSPKDDDKTPYNQLMSYGQKLLVEKYKNLSTITNIN